MNVCIVGTGYVGLVAAACYAEMGNDVYCIDVNPDIIKSLQEGKIHIYEPGLESLVKRNYAEGRLKFSTDLSEGLQDALFVFSSVGTPSQPDGSCDLSYVRQVAQQIGQSMTDYKIVINKSTVPVGTADMVRNIIQEELNKRDIKLEFDVVSNPEFLKEGQEVEIIYHANSETPISCELPPFVILEITYSEPGIKGDTSSTTAMKPATTETGVKINVPLFVNTGDKIKIDTRSKSYVERIKE